MEQFPYRSRGDSTALTEATSDFPNYASTSPDVDVYTSIDDAVNAAAEVSDEEDGRDPFGPRNEDLAAATARTSVPQDV